MTETEIKKLGKPGRMLDTLVDITVPEYTGGNENIWNEEEEPVSEPSVTSIARRRGDDESDSLKSWDDKVYSSREVDGDYAR
jgi:hypothetical protein